MTEEAEPGLNEPVQGATDPVAAQADSKRTAQVDETRSGWSRRRLLGAGISAGALAGAVTGGVGVQLASDDGQTASSSAQPFWAQDNGGHQAGIATPAQDRLHFASFDVVTTDRAELVELLRQWTQAAARMSRGFGAGPLGPTGGSLDAPPDDTGEAIGLPPSGLTVTIGFGPSLFDDRFGLAALRPAALAELPGFSVDFLDPKRCGGDLAVQACAHDPQVAVHAVRNLVRLGMGVVRVRWSQLGFGRTSSTTRDQATPRNMFGFKDGTNNIKAEDRGLMARHVWVPPADGPEWMVGGAYLVARRIRMVIESWDSTPLREQQSIFARFKGSGAPLTATDSQDAEFEQIDFAAKDDDGEPTIASDSHVRLASPQHNGGARMLRRGYNFTDGTDELGRLDAGLFFISFERDPRKQFVPIQRNLSQSDVMNEYIKHVGSALFACPPGARRGEFWGERLWREAGAV